VRPPLSEVLRLLWGLLLLLALAASPLLALVLLAVIVAFLHPFRRKVYGHPSVTLRGELVRSRSEKAIADWFCRNGVRYVYEYPAFDRRGSVISRPDFYLPDYGVHVEYWGLASLPDGSARSRYERSMRWKIAQYRRNGIWFVSLYPNELGSLDSAFKPKLEQAVG
jgi:hypothetical protein